ncbi:unnamed protein product [Umbelopsis ramanniana]
MFETKKTYYLIVDTCTLHHCSKLIRHLVLTSYFKKLNFKVVIPTIVIRELKQQETSTNKKNKIDYYSCWARVPQYKIGTAPIDESAHDINIFIEQCRLLRLPTLLLQGNHETKNYPIKIADDLLLDCLLYYHEKCNGNVALLSHDWELCCKARVFGMNAVSRHDHVRWRELLLACQIELRFDSFEPPKRQKYALTRDEEQELIYRPMVECDCDPLNMFSM